MSRIGPSSSSSSGGGLPGGLTKDPRLLPVCGPLSVDVYMFPGTSQSRADSRGFWNAIDGIGSYITSGTNDTYSTVCDVTGSGVLFHVIPFQNQQSNDNTFIRVTIDGVEYELQFSADTAALSYSSDSNRLILGYFEAGIDKYTSTTGKRLYGYKPLSNYTIPNGFAPDAGDQIYLPPPYTILNEGLPCLHFEESLKVEVKGDSLGSEGYSRYAGASYMILEA